MLEKKLVAGAMAFALASALPLAGAAFAGETDNANAGSNTSTPAAAAASVEASAQNAAASESVLAEIPAAALAEDSTSTAAVYRMYQPASGEHLYTTDYNEVVTLYTSYGWGYEGISWYEPTKGAPVWRLYNAGLGNHVYTSDTNEISTLTASYGWVLDNGGNPLMYSGGSYGVYRLYNGALSGAHLLTLDANEYAALPAYGWSQEGVALSAQALPEKYFANTHYSPSSLEDGWVIVGGQYRYEVGGVAQTGWVITEAWDGAGLQRYWINDDLSFPSGYFEVGGNGYYGLGTYVARNQSVTVNGASFYADNDGILHAGSLAENQAREIAASLGDDLYSCFVWCANHGYISMGYRDFYGTNNWLEEEALRFYAGGGDCYSYAAGFCDLARVLGYDAQVVAGYVPRSGGGTISHGWVEVYGSDGVTYICDPDLAHEISGYNWYFTTYDSAPTTYTK